MNASGAAITPSDLVLYRLPKGVVKVGVLVQGETVWLAQKALSEPFAVGVPAIAKHLKNIFEAGELEEAATVSSLETARQEDFDRMVEAAKQLGEGGKPTRLPRKEKKETKP